MSKKKIIVWVPLAVIILIPLWFRDAIKFGWKVGDHFERLELRKEQVEEIVLINIGEGDRQYLASIIDALSQCNPKIIAVDAFFLNLKDKQMDSILSRSIGKARCILATKGYGNGRFVESHQKFVSKALGTGVAQSFEHFGLMLTYKPIRKMRDPEGNVLNIKHFSVAVSLAYDSLKTQNFIDKVILDQEYLIDYHTTQESYKLYDYGVLSFDCEDVEGRIALMGYLGPTNEDKFKTPLGLLDDHSSYNLEKGDMYGPVILANEILSILEGRPTYPY